MEELLYNGIIYIRNRRGYWTRNNEIVHELLQRRLNAEWMNAFNIESFSVWRLRAEAVKCKENGDYVRAIQYLTRAMEIDNSRYYKRSYLAILSSCYRELQMPGKSIELYEQFCDQQYMLSAPFLTSVAAAYMDCGSVSKARALADEAYHLSYGHVALDLMHLNNRINAAS